MDGKRWPLVFGAVAVFGLLVFASGFMFASAPITLQGAALLAVGVFGLLFTAGRRPAWRERGEGERERGEGERERGEGEPAPSRWVPMRVPLAVPAGSLILVATAVETARTGLSVWAPLGLLAGVTLLGLPMRALPAPPRPLKEPRAAVVLVVIGLVLVVGYELLRHVLAPSAGDLPSYLAAVGMPFAAVIGAGALAVLAATRGGMAGLAAGGAMVLALAGLFMARAAGDSWWARHADFAGETAAPILVQTIGEEYSSAYQSAVAISFGGTRGFPSSGEVTLLLVLGLALVIVGWWWAAVRRVAGARPAV